MKKLLWIMQIKVFLFVLIFSTNAAAKIHEVQVSDFVFTPAVISTVEVGDTMRWIWVSGTHTTTSTSVPAGAATWDSPINSTSTTFDYKVTMVGSYAYKCTFHVAMGMVGSFTASFPSGINNNRSTAEILLYPNPFHNKLTIHYSSSDAPLKTISIYDLVGKKLKEFSFESSGSITEQTLNLDDLGQGVIFLDFRDSFGKSAVRRIIKD